MRLYIIFYDACHECIGTIAKPAHDIGGLGPGFGGHSVMPVGLVAPGRRLAYRPGAQRGTYIGKQDGAFREKESLPHKKDCFSFRFGV